MRRCNISAPSAAGAPRAGNVFISGAVPRI